MKKRLLIFHATIAPYRIDFFNSLNEAFEARICLMYRNLKSQKFDYSKIEDMLLFRSYYLKESPKLLGRRFYFGYLKHLIKFQPDIVITQEYSLGTAVVLLYKKLYRKHFKVVSICDDSYNMVAENNDFSWIHKVARKLLVPMLDDIILVETRTVEWYQDHYGKGIFFPIIKDDKKARKEYKRLLTMSEDTIKEYGLKGKRVLLFVGRLVALKNVQTAIRAFVQLNQDENVFVIIGDGPERLNLVRLAQDLNANVIFTGRLEGDELNQWYNIATCFILPSYQEPFGAVTNEALLAGCWGLISNKAGSQCLIENGRNGYTFNPIDVNELAYKMQLSICNVGGELNVEKPSRMMITYEETIRNLICHLLIL